MKKITSLSVLLLIALVGISQTLPNYSFENWVSNPFPAYEEPAPWNTPNPLTSIAQVVTVEKSDDAYSGNFSAKLTTRKVEVGNISYNAPGMVTYADFSVDPETLEYTFSGGLHITDRINSLSGMYKYSGQNDDSATVLIYTFRHPEGQEIDTVGYGFGYLHDAQNWTPFTVKMNYLGLPVYDTFNVLIMSTASFDINTMPLGSELLIDSITLQGSVGIFNLDAEKIDLHVFPNPATRQINFETTKRGIDRNLNIYDLSGKLIKEVPFNQKSLTIDIGNLPSGNYSYRIISNQKLSNSGTFIKE